MKKEGETKMSETIKSYRRHFENCGLTAERQGELIEHLKCGAKLAIVGGCMSNEVDMTTSIYADTALKHAASPIEGVFVGMMMGRVFECVTEKLLTGTGHLGELQQMKREFHQRQMEKLQQAQIAQAAQAATANPDESLECEL
jgi:hypothetical protein